MLLKLNAKKESELKILLIMTKKNKTLEQQLIIQLEQQLIIQLIYVFKPKFNCFII